MERAPETASLPRGNFQVIVRAYRPTPICTGITEIFQDDCGLVDFEMDVRAGAGLNNRSI
jgi:hypothetical protein